MFIRRTAMEIFTEKMQASYVTAVWKCLKPRCQRRTTKPAAIIKTIKFCFGYFSFSYLAVKIMTIVLVVGLKLNWYTRRRYNVVGMRKDNTSRKLEYTPWTNTNLTHLINFVNWNYNSIFLSFRNSAHLQNDLNSMPGGQIKSFDWCLHFLRERVFVLYL